MATSRRVFLLGSAASAAWVFGWEQLQDPRGQDPAKPKGEPAAPASRPHSQRSWIDALAAQKKRNAPGLVLAIPEVASERAAMLDLLNDLAEPHSMPGLALFARAVAVCVPRNHPALAPGENVALVDTDGARLAGATVGFGPDADRAEVAERLHALLDVRELPRWKEKEAAATAPGAREFESLLRGVPENQVPELKQVVAKATTPGSYVLWRYRVSKDERERQLCQEMIWSALMLPAERVPTLPFGVVEKPNPKAPKEDPCPFCGMAIRTRRATYVLEFLTDGGAK